MLVWGHDPSREAQQVKGDTWWPYFPGGPFPPPAHISVSVWAEPSLSPVLIGV